MRRIRGECFSLLRDTRYSQTANSSREVGPMINDGTSPGSGIEGLVQVRRWTMPSKERMKLAIARGRSAWTSATGD